MKRTLIWFTLLVTLIVFAGCGARAKFTMPDEPKFKTFEVYHLADGICMDAESIGILQENIKALKGYSDELRRVLIDLRKER